MTDGRGGGKKNQEKFGRCLWMAPKRKILNEAGNGLKFSFLGYQVFTNFLDQCIQSIKYGIKPSLRYNIILGHF